jgi:hypothetical protein
MVRRMPAGRVHHKSKKQRPERAPKKSKSESAQERPKYAPASFLSGSPQQVQSLCTDLAELAAERFSDLTGTTWIDVGQSLAQQLRALGHDLIDLEGTPEHQLWQATWYHPKGTFVFTLEFKAPYAASVTWQTDDTSFSASR